MVSSSRFVLNLGTFSYSSSMSYWPGILPSVICSFGFGDFVFLINVLRVGISVLISSTGIILWPFISLFMTLISHFNVWLNSHFLSSTRRMTISVVEQILPFVSSHETVILCLLKGFLDFNFLLSKILVVCPSNFFLLVKFS